MLDLVRSMIIRYNTDKLDLNIDFIHMKGPSFENQRSAGDVKLGEGEGCNLEVSRWVTRRRMCYLGLLLISVT